MLVPGPQQFQLGRSEVINGLMNGKIELVSHHEQFVLPFAHLFATPACNGVFVNRKSFIGDDKILVYPDYTSKPFTGFTGAKRIVKTEKIFRWFFKEHTIGFKTV